jgi:type VI secretion system protein ImpG
VGWSVVFPAELPWFEIDVVLAERWEHDFSFTEKHLRLNVPVINLFPLESDPLTLNSLQTEYMLRPMRVQDGHTEIYGGFGDVIEPAYLRAVFASATRRNDAP